MENKKLFLEVFNKAYPKKRLLAIHLNGFSHSVLFDDGKKDSKIISAHYSSYTDKYKNHPLEELFGNVGHYFYQNNPQEIIYVFPEER